MFFRTLYILFLLFMATPLLVRAEPPAEAAVLPPAHNHERLTLERAVQEALGENPALKARQSTVEAYRARIGQVRSLDNPMIGVEFEDVPITTSDVTQGMETNYSFIQPLPFPSKLVTRGQVARKNYLATQSLYETSRIGVVVETEHAFHGLYFLERALKINRELQGVFGQMAASEEGEYAAGHGLSQNFLKARVERDQLRNEAALLEAKIVQARARLNILRNRLPDEEIFLAELPQYKQTTPAYEELEKKVLERHPELKAYQYQVEARRSNLSLARQELALPDFQARFTYGYRYGVNQDTWTAEAMMTLPFFWGKNRKGVKEAQHMEKAAEREYAGAKNNLLAELRQSHALYESSRKSHAIFRGRVLPQASLALQSAKAAYFSGQGDFLSLIDAARRYKEAKLETLKAFVDSHRALSHLKGAVGEDFLSGDLGGEK